MNRNIIKSDEHLNSLFPNKPIIAYKRNRYLKDTLVRDEINTKYRKTNK